MATQTATQVEDTIERPAGVYALGNGRRSTSSKPEGNGNILERRTPLEPLEFERVEQAPEGATVFTTPNAREVKGKLFSTYWSIFIAGLNDAALGTLIPFLQPAYQVGLLEIAILYLVNFAGWLLAAFTNVHATSRFGQGGVLLVGGILQLFAYVLIFWEPPYPLFAVSFFFSGLGIAYQDAQSNTFAANVENAHYWLGLLHAAYGAGALVAPLVATSIAATTPHWSYYYCVMLGVGALNVAFLAFTFRKALFKPASKSARETASDDLKGALSQKVVWIMSLFLFFYVGAEVTSGGWVVQFLVTVRGGSPGQVGYAATGFWGGLTLGRLTLSGVVNKFGERRMIFILIASALALQFLFWFVPNIVADAVFMSVLGFCIGQFFPVAISVLTKLLPREYHVAAIGFVATFGQAGSAAFPFMTGAIASSRSVQVLQPIMVALLAAMFVSWAILPRVRKPAK